MDIIITKSTKGDKKFMAIITSDSRKKTVHFGASGYEDYTIHKDYERMLRYTNRHQSREDWTINGIRSAGFWSKWILWNKPTLQGSIRDTAKRFGLKIRYIA